MNQETFWSEYIKYFGRVKNPKTIQVVNAIIDYCDFKKLNKNQIAYILATAYHETAHDFIPKREFGSNEYFVRRYWNNTKVAKWLGNDSASEAIKYCGRGLVQITGETNYEKFGITDNPEKALETEMAVKILVDGMINGIFTSRKLSNYITEVSKDFFNARKIINGLDKAELIASYAERFIKIMS